MQYSVLDQRPAALMGPYCEKNQVKVLAYGTVHSHLDLSCLPAPTHALPHTHRGRQLSWGLRKILEFSPSENLRRCLSTEIKFESRSSCATRYVLTKGAPSYRLRGALPTVGRIVQALGAHNHHQHCHCHCQKPPCAPRRTWPSSRAQQLLAARNCFHTGVFMQTYVSWAVPPGTAPGRFRKGAPRTLSDSMTSPCQINGRGGVKCGRRQLCQQVWSPHPPSQNAGLFHSKVHELDTHLLFFGIMPRCRAHDPARMVIRSGWGSKVNPGPCTLDLETCTLHPAPCTLNPQP